MMNRLLYNDNAVRILSVLLAVILWMQVTGQSRESEVLRTFQNLEVQCRNLPAELTIVDLRPASVSITVKASREVMSEVTAQDFEASVNLQAAESGSLEFYVAVVVPRGVQLVQVTPDAVTVEVEDETEVSAPVKAVLPEAYVPHVRVAAIQPLEVTVRGPNSEVLRVEQVVASVVPDGRIEAETELAVECRAIDAEGRTVRSVEIMPGSVAILLRPSEPEIEKVVQVQPLLALTLPEGCMLQEVSVEPSEVTITGPMSLLGGIDVLHTSVVSVAPGDTTVPHVVTATIQLPSGIECSESEARVTIILEEVQR